MKTPFCVRVGRDVLICFSYRDSSVLFIFITTIEHDHLTNIVCLYGCGTKT